MSALALGFYGLILGAVVGLVFGLVSRAVDGERFTSSGSMEADHFDVVVDHDLVERARGVLHQSADRPSSDRDSSRGQRVAGR